jgi:starvation-inducible DNA-binding protein
VSKAKSDKVSPDLDTPTDLPQPAVDKISASLKRYWPTPSRSI